jgi:NitT/TauT family transport system substrate-binding protein
MRIRFNNPGVSLVLTAALLVTACTSAATPAPTAAPTAAPSSAESMAPESQAPETTPLPGVKKFTVAFTSRGLSSVAMMEAIDILNKSGYQIDTPEIAQSNLIVEGVINNQFQITSGTTLSFLVAAQKNGPIRTIGNRLNNEWTIAGIASIKSCDDTNGKVWAHHTESAVSTGMARAWVKANCTGGTTTAQEVFIQGSDIRRAAIQAGQVDLAEQELSDAKILETEPDKFRIIAPFSTDLPNLKPSMIAANSEWLAANPGSVVALLTELLKQHKKITDDASGAYLKSLAEKWVPNAIDAPTIGDIAKFYANAGLFAPDGGVTADDVAYTIKFFEDAGSLEPGLTVDKASDLTYLKMAQANAGM